MINGTKHQEAVKAVLARHASRAALSLDGVMALFQTTFSLPLLPLPLPTVVSQNSLIYGTTYSGNAPNARPSHSLIRPFSPGTAANDLIESQAEHP